MIIRHKLPPRNFTRIDRYVFTNENLSDGAKVLYGYLCGLKNGANFCDVYLMGALKLQKPALAKRKRELKKAGLILTEQISARVYVIYIGYTGCLAEQVKAEWTAEEDKYND